MKVHAPPGTGIAGAESISPMYLARMPGMLNTVSEELRETRAVLTRRKKMQARLRQVRKEMAFYQRQIKTLDAQLNKEERDVNKLENISVRALFLKILGNHSQQLERKRQEHLMAALKYNESLDALNLLNYEVSLLERKIKDIPSLEARCAALFDRKSRMLKESDRRESSKLKALDREQELLDKQKLEIDGALAAGKVVLARLRTMHGQLKNVKGAWGNTLMQGKGRYSSYAKKSYIDKARKSALQTHLALEKFETEVQDVFARQRIAISFDRVRFEKFLETFYNNLLTDWIVQRSVHHVIKNVQSVTSDVQQVQASLKTELQHINKKLGANRRARQKLILSC